MSTHPSIAHVLKDKKLVSAWGETLCPVVRRIRNTVKPGERWQTKRCGIVLVKQWPIAAWGSKDIIVWVHYETRDESDGFHNVEYFCNKVD